MLIARKVANQLGQLCGYSLLHLLVGERERHTLGTITEEILHVRHIQVECLQRIASVLEFGHHQLPHSSRIGFQTRNDVLH